MSSRCAATPCVKAAATVSHTLWLTLSLCFNVVECLCLCPQQDVDPPLQRLLYRHVLATGASASNCRAATAALHCVQPPPQPRRLAHLPLQRLALSDPRSSFQTVDPQKGWGPPAGLPPQRTRRPAAAAAPPFHPPPAATPAAASAALRRLRPLAGLLVGQCPPPPAAAAPALPAGLPPRGAPPGAGISN